MRNRKGFTLIELMIVVAIIAILAAIAIPNFLKFQAKSKQSEARTMLTGVYEAEMGYFATENRFSGDALEIGFEPASPPKYYLDPSMPGWITANAVTGFTATTSGNIDRDAFRDYWVETDRAREPYNTTDGTIDGPSADDVSL
ncbi:MAG: prepilin-type N-terminal cleavage/methylation domain-containing protein [Deltaproteobacteria bacterium]|nr:prepilin-type N-terminal cleavage/methylation domain-containing protein [Candidatus Zymogenaceae bacterium]